MRWVLCLLAVLTLVHASASAQNSRRVALVIANAGYFAATPLTNPPNDARLVADALRRAGFDTVEVKTDLSVVSFRSTLRGFRVKASEAQVALVYYAGHGIEANGKNWLIPTDAKLESNLDLTDEAIDLDRVIADVSGAALQVVILDACRNNPFGRSWGSRSRAIDRGLGAVDIDDVLVIFAAAPGQTASDGVGVNSPFATALAQRLTQPDLPIQLLGNVVRDDVVRATGNRQRPYVSASMTGELFYLVPRTRDEQISQNPPTATSANLEALTWQGALAANSVAAFEDYLRRYPNGQFSEQARQNVARIKTNMMTTQPSLGAQITSRDPKVLMGAWRLLGSCPSGGPDFDVIEASDSEIRVRHDRSALAMGLNTYRYRVFERLGDRTVFETRRAFGSFRVSWIFSDGSIEWSDGRAKCRFVR